MKKDEILKALEDCEVELVAWKNKNDILWKNAFKQKQQLLQELESLPKEIKMEEKPVKLEEKKITKPKFEPTDVNKDGKTDLKDLGAVGKRLFKGKKK